MSQAPRMLPLSMADRPPPKLLFEERRREHCKAPPPRPPVPPAPELGPNSPAERVLGIILGEEPSMSEEQVAAVQDFVNKNSELEDEEVVFPDNQPSEAPPAHLLESAKKGEPEPQEPSVKEGEPEHSSEPQEEGTELDDSWLRGAEAIRAEVLLERILDGGTEHYVHLVLSDEGGYLNYPDTTTCEPSSQPSSSSGEFQGPIERSAAQHQSLEPKTQMRKFIPSTKLQGELYRLYFKANGWKYPPEEDSSWDSPEEAPHPIAKEIRQTLRPTPPSPPPPQHLLEKSPRFLEELPKQPASQPPQHLLEKSFFALSELRWSTACKTGVPKLSPCI